MKRYYFLLLALCFTALASAQIDRSKAPASGPAPKVSIGEYESFTLKNGLKVLGCGKQQNSPTEYQPEHRQRPAPRR